MRDSYVKFKLSSQRKSLCRSKLLSIRKEVYVPTKRKTVELYQGKGIKSCLPFLNRSRQPCRRPKEAGTRKQLNCSTCTTRISDAAIWSHSSVMVYIDGALQAVTSRREMAAEDETELLRGSELAGASKLRGLEPQRAAGKRLIPWGLVSLNVWVMRRRGKRKVCRLVGEFEIAFKKKSIGELEYKQLHELLNSTRSTAQLKDELQASRLPVL